MEKIKVGFVSLGCPKNMVDCERMIAIAENAGYEIVAEDIDADVVVVNTCAFIESAKEESIEAILDLAWLKENRHLRGIVVAGCMAERYRDDVLNEMPEVDAVIGVGSYDKVAEAIAAVAKGEKYSDFGDKNASSLCGERVLTTPEFYAYLKIAEGCDNRCTYCAIPDIRGHFRSRTIEDIVEEAIKLDNSGVKELILVAQDDTRYGMDLYGKPSLPELVRAICAATAIPWIRLLYCYPDLITDELISELRDNPRLIKYVDLPIQHITEKMLRRMNRRGGEKAVRDAVSRLRAGVPGITIRSTVITGFPGESEEDFDGLLSFVREAKFDRLGAFAYSQEEGTPAGTYEDQIDEQVRADRADAIMEAQLEITAARNESLVGSELDVLCEGYDVVAETYYGRSKSDAPDIDGKVYFSSKKKVKAGAFVRVAIEEAMDYDLIGSAIDDIAL